VLQIGTLSTNKLTGILLASGGVPDTVAALAAEQSIPLPGIAASQIIAQNVPPEIAERSSVTKYPIVCMYCNKISNVLREKFRTFSGDADMVIEARISQDRLEDVGMQTQLYVDAITQVLDSNRGDWGNGVFFSGKYEVVFGGVKQGGLNFIQIAKVSFVLDISADC
jgi:hypothetical protein